MAGSPTTWRVQDARLQQLIAEYQDTVLRAYQEVEDGVVAFLKAQERSEILEKSVKANERAVQLSVLQYREGVATYTRVLTTQQDLVRRQDRLTEAQSDIAQGLIATYRALGGGWQSRDINDFVPDTVLDEMRERTDWGNIIPPDDLQEAPSSTEGVQENRHPLQAPRFLTRPSLEVSLGAAGGREPRASRSPVRPRTLRQPDFRRLGATESESPEIV